LATRSYGFLLQRFRSRDARDLAAIHDTARSALADAGGRGGARLTRTWAALVADIVVTGLRHDVGQAVRFLTRTPGFTIAVSAVLGTGIAVTATLFALVDAVLLRPLPYDDPDRLVMVWESNQSQGWLREGPSPANVIDWTARNQVFDSLTAWMTTSMTLRGRDGAAPVTGVQVTRGFFEVFRRQPLLGRTFAADEYEGAAWNVANRFVGRERLIVMSHRLWRELGADTSIAGRTIFIEGHEWRILGVMPADFAVPDSEAAFWTPWDMAASYRDARFPEGPPRDFRFLRATGRLKRDMSLRSASAHMDALAAQLAADYPAVNAGWGVHLTPFAEELVGASRAELLAVFTGVFCLLVLVCINMAGLSVARASARARELSIRLALGAGRTRLARQLITESALVAVLSAGVALLLTTWWLDAVVAFAPRDIPRLHEVALDRRLVIFVVVIAGVVTAVAGVIPALRGSRVDMPSALKDGAPAAGDRRTRLRRLLVAGELAVALMLLVGAGLLMRTFVELRRVDPGFDPDNVLVLRITPDAARYRTGAQAADYYRRVLEELRAVPAVSSAAAVSLLPLSAVGADFDRPYWPDGERPAADRTPEADIRMATPGYFATLRRTLSAGREFTDADDRAARRVIVVNESLARRTWPGEDAVGRTVIVDYQGGAYPYEVVGVARDALHYGPRREPRPEIFIPHAQNPYLVMNVVVRTAIEPEGLAQTARAQALRVDPDQPVHSVTTMNDLRAASMEQDRFGALLLVLFAAAGLVVAGTGVYSLCSYTVSQRRREIAVRMAVGASAGRVARLVLTESLMLAAAGAVVGLAGALAMGRLAGALLFGISPYDPWTVMSTVTLLAVIVLAATWLPARRACLVDPATTMRN
jgi:putative ABC transport system permease protein